MAHALYVLKLNPYILLSRTMECRHCCCWGGGETKVLPVHGSLMKEYV